MDHCPICNSPEDTGLTTCQCGYGFAEQKIVDSSKLRLYLAKILENGPWYFEVHAKRKIHEVQRKKHGETRPGKRGGWSFEKTAALLGESKGLTKPDIELSLAVDEFPEIRSCRNKTEAKKRLKTIKEGQTTTGEIATFDFEAQLQEYFFRRWNETIFHEDWTIQETGVLRQGKYNTQAVGEIDLLAKHRKEDRWLVIELKKGQSSDETVGQVLRYMGWVKEHLAGETGKVEGVIISNAADERIRYSLVCVPNIDLKIYTHENGQLKIESPQRAYLLALVKKMTPIERERLIRELSKESSD